MHFTDAGNRRWEITIDGPAISRVRSTLGIDLNEARSGRLMNRLADLATFVDVLYVLCKDQADAAGYDDEEFGRLIATGYSDEERPRLPSLPPMGHTFTAAVDAFSKELAGLSPELAKTRDMVWRAVDATARV